MKRVAKDDPFQGEAKFRKIFDESPVGTVMVGLDNRFIKCNMAFCKFLGYAEEELIGKCFQEVTYPEDLALGRQEMKWMMNGELESARFQKRYLTKEGEIVWGEINITLLRDAKHEPLFYLPIIQDITEQKQIEQIHQVRTYLHQFADDHTLDDLLEETLNETEKLTGSLISFYHFVDMDKQMISLQNWSTRTKKEFCHAPGKGESYPISEAGVWMDCVKNGAPVIHNDYNSLQSKKGLPQGHAVVTRELVVPVIRNKKAVAILGIGNKPLDYSQKDVKTVSILADLAWDIAERKLAADILKQKEEKVRKKLNAILEPDIDLTELDLSDIIDFQPIQLMMEEFYRVTKMGIGVLDRNGNILVGVGWQDICMNFHRKNPHTLRRCHESDTSLTSGVPEGTFQAYHCKNNMWDIMTPIIIGGKHFGNVCLGQFFYTDEVVDYDFFLDQANKFGFDVTEYMDALNRVPRFDKNKVDAVMAFYARLAKIISSLSYSTIKLARAMSQKDAALQRVMESEQLLKDARDSLEFRVELRTQELIKNKKLLDDTSRLARIGGWELEVPTQNVIWTDMVYEIHEVEKDFLPTLATGIGFYAPASLPVISSAITKAIHEGIPFDLELQIITAKNHLLWVRTIGQPIIKDGQIEKISGVFQDITRQKETENELNEIHKNLEVINQELNFHLKESEQFTYIASHDLQEPLRTLTTFTQLLHDEFAGKLENDGTRYLDFIQQSASRMSALVTGLLDYALIGKTCEKSLVDMNDVIKIVMDNLEKMINENEATVSWTALSCVTGYRIELRQLLQQLVANGIKFRRKGQPSIIHISMKKVAKEWLFSVADNGIGIKEKDREKIFTIFKRMHNRKEYEGTGIGLAHCKKIVELHGGRIWMTPNDTEGSTFHFTIPMLLRP